MRVVRKDGPGKAQLRALLQGLKTQHVHVGFLETAKYESGTPVAYVAAIHEYGCPEVNIPPRPFFAPTVAARQTEWQALAKQLGKEVLAGNRTSAQLLEALGLVAAGNVAETITAVTSPALAESTIINRLRRRAVGSPGNIGKPLVDTGILLSSVTAGPVTDGKGEK